MQPRTWAVLWAAGPQAVLLAPALPLIDLFFSLAVRTFPIVACLVPTSYAFEALNGFEPHPRGPWFRSISPQLERIDVFDGLHPTGSSWLIYRQHTSGLQFPFSQASATLASALTMPLDAIGSFDFAYRSQCPALPQS